MHMFDINTFVVFGSLCDFVQDDGVGDENYNKWDKVDGCYGEDVVGQLMTRWREEVKRHTLLKPGMGGMALNVEDDTLQIYNNLKQHIKIYSINMK